LRQRTGLGTVRRVVGVAVACVDTLCAIVILACAYYTGFERGRTYQLRICTRELKRINQAIEKKLKPSRAEQPAPLN
jgi:hypothetical protein